LVPTPAEQTALVSSPANQPLGRTALYHRFGRFLRGVDLTAAQQTQISTYIQQFRQAHPPGSAFDPQGLRTLHERILALLTPDQIAQVQSNLEIRRMWYTVDLTDRQRAQIHQLMMQYRAAHPPGSAYDAPARQSLHQEIMNLLTPAQRAQLKSGWVEAPPGGPAPH
jgi:Spy/CpxP family protein refolding chaperone